MNKLYQVSLIIGMVVAGLALVGTSILYVIMSPSAMAMGVVVAVIYTAVVLPLFRLTPAWPKPSPGWRWVAASFLWGGGTAVAMANVFSLGVLYMTERLGWRAAEAAFGGAVEEIFKLIGAWIIVLSFRRMNRPWDALATGFIVGLGFEVCENVMYGVMTAGMDPNSDIAGSTSTWVMRIIAGPLIHAVWTGLAAWGMGKAVFAASKSTWWRIGVAALWLGLAYALHFAWNYQFESITLLVIKMIVITIIGHGIFIWLLVRTHFLKKREVPTARIPAVLTSVADLTHYQARYLPDPHRYQPQVLR